MYIIKNIGEEPFAIAGCPLLQKGETAEVTAYTMNMVRFNPNIEIVSGGLKWVEPETVTDTKTKKSSTVKGIE